MPSISYPFILRITCTITNHIRLENPSGSSFPDRGSCGEKGRWCELSCGRAKPGHTGHSCYTHRHCRDGKFHGCVAIGSECGEFIGHEFSDFTAIAIQAKNLLRCSVNLYLKVLACFLHSQCRHCIRWQRTLLGTRDSLQLSDTRCSAGSDLNQGCNVPPPQQFPVDSIRIVPGITPLQIPPENLPVIRSWTTLQPTVELPQPPGCWGYSESVPIGFVPNRPFAELLHPPRHQQGAINRVCFSSASPVLC